MKASFTLASVLLAASPAFAGVVPFNGVLPGGPDRRDLGQAGGLSERATCNEDNVLRALQNPTRSVDASSFCSAYLQPTTAITSTATISQTAVITTTSTVTTSTTVATTNTVSVTCAASPTGTVVPTCNYPAYGFYYYLISQNPNTDPVTCHELCLQDPNCKSFQVQSGGQQYCNLYNQPTANYVQYAPDDVYTFFDRDCPDYLPAACTLAPSPKEKRDVEKRTATTAANLSTILATVPATRISSACSCLITSPAATATVTIPALATTSTSTTTTVIATTTGTEIDTLTATATAIVTASP